MSTTAGPIATTANTVTVIHADGTQPTTYGTIQDAINAASAGDTVQIGGGTYTENVHVNKDNLTLENVSGETVTVVGTGGFAGAITVDANVNGTTIQSSDGVQSNFVLQGDPAGQLAALYVAGSNSNTTITGITTVASDTGAGGGHNSVLTGGSETGLTFSSNVFTGNAAQLVYVNGPEDLGPQAQNGAVTFSNNTFSGNAGLLLGLSAPGQVSGNTFSGTSDVAVGLAESDVTVSGNTFASTPTQQFVGTNTTYDPTKLEAQNTFPNGHEAFIVHNGTAQGGVYSSIQAAIADAQAGDTIVAGAGTFSEHLTIDKAVTIQGANFGVNGHGTRGAETDITGGVTISADGVTLDGVKIDGSYNSVAQDGTDLPNGMLVKSNDATIQNSVFTGEGAALDSRPFSTEGGITGFAFSNNAVTGWQDGAYIVNGGIGSISGNFFDNNGNGIVTESTGMVISANSFQHSSANPGYTIGSDIATDGNQSTVDLGTFVKSDNTFGGTHPLSVFLNASGAVTVTNGTAINARIHGEFAGGPLTYTGGTANDTVTGTALNDTFNAGSGNETIDGGGGFDTLVYGSPLTASDITAANGHWTVTGASGTDTLTGVDKVTDGSFLLVGPGGFATIQDAVDHAQAGDTILIAGGTYNENVNVTVNGLTIENVSGQQVTITGTGGFGGAITVATGVTGTTIQSSDDTPANFVLQGASGGQLAALYLAGGNDNTTVNGITATSSDVGAGGGHNAVLTGGNLNHVTFQDSVFSGNAAQLVYVNGAESVGAPNSDINFANNTFSGTAGLLLGLEGTGSVTGNTFSGTSDVELGLAESGVTVTGNTFSGATTAPDHVRFGGNGTYDSQAIVANNNFPNGEVTIQGQGHDTVYATIQAAVDAASAGDTILIGAGTFDGATIDKALTIDGSGPNTIINTNGAGDGLRLTGDIDAGTASVVAIDGITFVNNVNGVSVSSTTQLNDLEITNSTFSNSSISGVAMGSGAPGLANITIGQSVFQQNGNGSQNGDGDISLFGFNGNATLQDLTITGGPNKVPNNGNADFAIQINGRDPATYDVTQPIGNVVFDNVTVNGSYAKTSVYVQGYTDLNGLSFADSGSGGTTIAGHDGWGIGMLLDPMAGEDPNAPPNVPGQPGFFDAAHAAAETVDLTNVSVTNDVANSAAQAPLDSVLNATTADNTFIAPTTGTNVFNGGPGFDTLVYATPLTAADITAANGHWTVTGTSGTDILTGVEKVTDGSFLLVGSGGFATIQDAVDHAQAGDTILIAGGTYNENVNVTVNGLTIENVTGQKVTVVGTGGFGGAITVATGVTGTTIQSSDDTPANFVLQGASGGQLAALYLAGGNDNTTVNGITATSSDVGAGGGHNAVLTGGNLNHVTFQDSVFSGNAAQLVYVNGTESLGAGNQNSDINFANNTFSGTAGLLLGLEGTGSVTGNTFSGTSDVELGLAEPGVTVKGNTFSGTTTNPDHLYFSGDGSYNDQAIVDNNSFPNGEITISGKDAVFDIAAGAGVVVTGTAEPGHTLTAHAGSNDSDTTFTYQWQRSNDGGATFTDIAGATSADYTLQPADAGKQIDVVATANDPDSNTVSALTATSPAIHVQGMTVDSFVAVESKTGDEIFGALYDNTGRYSVGSSVVQGTDDAGGQWTYTVTGIAEADAAHQDASYSGLVYDYDYRDADVGTTLNTAYGYQGFVNHNNDKANFSGNNGLGSDGDLAVVGNKFVPIASGKYVVSDTPAPEQAGALEAVSYRAVESVTGDVITGVLFDNTGTLTVGSSVDQKTADNAGGHWTYTVTNIAAPDSAHQDSALAGFSYDQTYFDADQGKTFSTVFGAKGFASGDRTTNYSGKNGLGSDGDAVTTSQGTFAIASGKYVVPDAAPQMQEVSYQAVESKTGDVITGVLFDNTGKYSVGSTVTSAGQDDAGGQWTYTVNAIGAADAAHQSPSYNGFAYDLTYFDADLQQTVSTAFGSKGFNTGAGDRTANYSGKDGLGSDGDVVTINGSNFAIASGKYVVPEPQQNATTMQEDFFTAVESATGDTISGVLFDNKGLYTVGSNVTPAGTDDAGGHWTYTVNSVGLADSKHQDASYSGFVYDLNYHDADSGKTFDTVFGLKGFDSGSQDRTANYSGNNGLGSDGDLVEINGHDFAVASGKYVLPENLPAGTVAPQTSGTFAPSSAAAPEPIMRTDPVTVGAGATVDVKEAYAGTATFAGTTGTLQLERSADSLPQISGFGGADQIDLRDISPATATLGFTANAGGGSLSVSDGARSANLALLGNYTAASFATASDGQGGTLVSDAQGTVPPIVAQPHAG